MGAHSTAVASLVKVQKKVQKKRAAAAAGLVEAWEGKERGRGGKKGREDSRGEGNRRERNRRGSRRRKRRRKKQFSHAWNPNPKP